MTSEKSKLLLTKFARQFIRSNDDQKMTIPTSSSKRNATKTSHMKLVPRFRTISCRMNRLGELQRSSLSHPPRLSPSPRSVVKLEPLTVQIKPIEKAVTSTDSFFLVRPGHKVFAADDGPCTMPSSAHRFVLPSSSNTLAMRPRIVSSDVLSAMSKTQTLKAKSLPFIPDLLPDVVSAIETPKTDPRFSSPSAPRRDIEFHDLHGISSILLCD